ncbi:MAG TPA: hypothetical protein VFO79_03965, partial [Xanthomonadales bacterium]|nr:hypothetical protein [Xanthomonadales bacterium]
PTGTLVLNRPAPHLEMKSTLALLSQAADDERLAAAIGLEADERAAVIAHVPWTRWLRADEWHGADFDGALADVAANPHEYVLKRSWSYGGRDVFVGATLAAGDVAALAGHAYPDVTSWPALVARAAADARGGGFVVQRAVRTERSAQVLCTEGTAVRADVITDYAAYASLGATAAWSGVARASVDPIVNIVRGGAVVPVIRRSVYERLGVAPAPRGVLPP